MYVDDLIVIGDSTHAIENIIKMIYYEFKYRDLGILKTFLAIEVTKQNDSSIMLIQARYVMDFLIKFYMILCKPCRSLAISRTKLKIDEGFVLEDPTQFRMLAGSLQYLTLT